MNIEVSDIVELEDGGAVVTLELDEEARCCLISEAIKSRILAGLEAVEEADTLVSLYGNGAKTI